jgi:hypothetical protein
MTACCVCVCVRVVERQERERERKTERQKRESERARNLFTMLQHPAANGTRPCCRRPEQQLPTTLLQYGVDPVAPLDAALPATELRAKQRNLGGAQARPQRVGVQRPPTARVPPSVHRARGGRHATPRQARGEAVEGRLVLEGPVRLLLAQGGHVPPEAEGAPLPAPRRLREGLREREARHPGPVVRRLPRRPGNAGETPRQQSRQLEQDVATCRLQEGEVPPEAQAPALPNVLVDTEEEFVRQHAMVPLPQVGVRNGKKVPGSAS